jgi:hypothetical protein
LLPIIAYDVALAHSFHNQRVLFATTIEIKPG